MAREQPKTAMASHGEPRGPRVMENFELIEGPWRTGKPLVAKTCRYKQKQSCRFHRWNILLR